MSSPLLYTAELDLAESDVNPFRQWYANRHAPDVYQAGFLTCTCYQAVEGDMNLLDLYELADWGIFDSLRYKGMQGRDPYMAPLMARRRNKAHTVYSQQLIAPDEPGGWLNADWLSVFRFDSPAGADAAIVLALSVELGRLRDLGLTRLRFACRDRDHPTNPTFRPRCMVVTEWPRRPPEEAELPARLTNRFGDRITNPNVFVGRRIYPWPDRLAPDRPAPDRPAPDRPAQDHPA